MGPSSGYGVGHKNGVDSWINAIIEQLCRGRSPSPAKSRAVTLFGYDIFYANQRRPARRASCISVHNNKSRPAMAGK